MEGSGGGGVGFPKIAYSHNQSLLKTFSQKIAYCSLSGKHTPCKLSFVYKSYIRYGIRAVPKFGKQASLFSYHKDKKYV